LNPIKQLAGQTVVYGFGVIIPRMLNYLLLTPFYTRVFSKAEYGIITELYTYVVFLLIILTYGMETGFFRFSQEKEGRENVFKTSLISLFTTSLIFVLLVWFFSGSLAVIINYEDYPQYILWLSIVVALDAFTAIPVARLRLNNKAGRYTFIRITEVVVNIASNWFFIIYCHNNYGSVEWIEEIYNPEIRVGYVFVSNLLASVVKTVLLAGQIFRLEGSFRFTILKRMLNYSFPLLIAGLAGTINEAIDKVLIKYRMNPEDMPMEQLGIYGANFKLAVLMTLFIQMFRYAAEPFFFNQKNEKNANRVFADVMKYFVLFCMIIFLGVTLFIDVFQLFIGEEFREGVYVVPIILMANLFMGIFYNLSVWYKLSNKTRFGALLVSIGAVITFLINYIFIPEYGYLASAWGHFISYFVMIVCSYLLGKKYLKINYDIKRIFIYIISGVFIFILFEEATIENAAIEYFLKALSVVLYIFVFILSEKKSVNRYMKL